MVVTYHNSNKNGYDHEDDDDHVISCVSCHMSGSVEETRGLIRFWTEHEDQFNKKKFAAKQLWE